MKAYYKTCHPTVVAAWKQYQAEVRVVKEEGLAFADMFEGTLYVNNGSSGFHVSGIKLKANRILINKRFWMTTKSGLHRPRRTSPGATVAEKAELKTLTEKWDANFPRREASFLGVLAALGLNHSQVLIFGGIGMFEEGDFLWITTHLKLNDTVVEILSSELAKAKEKHDAED